MKSLTTFPFPFSSPRGLVIVASALMVFAVPTTSVAGSEICRGSGSGDVTLNEDADCSGIDNGPALTLRGTLNLNGHSLFGNPTLSATSISDAGRRSTIYCPDVCRIVGPGSVVLGSDAVVYAENGVTIENVDIVAEGATQAVRVANGVAKIDGSTVSGSYGNGVVSTRVEVRDSAIFGNGNDGVRAQHADIARSELSANGGDGVHALSTTDIRKSIVSGNDGSGVVVQGDLKLSGTEVTGNGGYGVTGATVIHERSKTGENCSNPGDIVCADLRSCEAPSVGDGNCGSSVGCNDAASPWGACSAD